MPSYNVTLEDSSPMWTYKGAWQDHSTSDSLASFYSDRSRHGTQQAGASASIAFNGTGVYLYGGMRYDHDTYDVTVGGERTVGSGFRSPPDSAPNFQQNLFKKSNLQPGSYEVVLTDTSTKDSSNSWLDLDWGELTLGDGDASTSKSDTIMDDNSPNITYTGDWLNSPNGSEGGYWGNSVHRTNVQGAKSTVLFHGNAVMAFGSVSGNHGVYTVSLDGGAAQTFNGSSIDYRAQQILYLASSLDLADHTLVITNTAESSDIWFDLDYVVATTWDGAKASALSTTSGPSAAVSTTVTVSGVGPTDNPDKGDHEGISTGAIVGGAVGAVAGVLILGLLAFLLFFRRRRRVTSNPRNSHFEVDMAAFDPYRDYGDASATAASRLPLIPPSASLPSSRAGPMSGASWTAAGVPSEYGGIVVPRSRQNSMPTEHVDLPPPGYDQVLRNSPAPTSSMSSLPLGMSATMSGTATPPEALARGPYSPPIRSKR